MKKAIYAGSFDPPTLGHQWMIEEGAKLFDTLIVAIGTNPNKKTKYTLNHRAKMLVGMTSHLNVSIEIFSNEYLVRFAQDLGAGYILRGIRNEQDYEYERSMRYVNEDIALMCNIPQTVFLMPPKHLIEVSSSFIKSMIGFNDWKPTIKKYLPEAVYDIVLEQEELVRQSKVVEAKDE